jgi:uncharacterized protein (DUF2461 family)
MVKFYINVRLEYVVVGVALWPGNTRVKLAIKRRVEYVVVGGASWPGIGGLNFI